MARFKPIDRGMKLLPIDLCVQLLPGTFRIKGFESKGQSRKTIESSSLKSI